MTTISGPFAYTVPATPAASQTAVLGAGSSYATTSLPVDCPLSYTLMTVSPDAPYAGGQLITDGNGKLTVDTNTLSNDNYYIKVSSSHGAVVNTNNFNVKVVCGTTSNTITNPTLVSAQTFTIDGSTMPSFSVPAFTVAQDACPITAIDIFDSVGGTSPPAFMSPGSITSPGSAFSVFSTRMNTKATYDFYMRVTTAGGMVYWANVAGDQKFTLTVNCAAMTVQPTAPANPTYTYSAAPTTTTGAPWSSFFVNPGADNCVTSSCQLLAPGCGGAYVRGNQAIQASSPFNIVSDINVVAGYVNEPVCIECTNG